MRDFIITFKENKKYNEITRTTKISVIKSTKDIGEDAKSALNIFIKSFGNLKKNDVFSIQEVDENGVSVGDPITPMEDTSIVPTKK